MDEQGANTRDIRRLERPQQGVPQHAGADILPGITPVNRKTGMQASEGDPDMIMEAFKPGTGPADSFTVIGMEGTLAPEEILRTSPQARQAVESGPGGLF